jgi:5-oxoprolinase (ATP-hydrolysing) subunit A
LRQATSRTSIDLNADLGEYPDGDDAAILGLITSANIACGVHAGDALSIDRTVQLALVHRVAIGAHPSFPDRAGFGRTNMRLSAVELAAWIGYQIGSLAAIAHTRGARVMHVKPHGAMYNMASVDAELAAALATTVRSLDPSLVLVGPPSSALLEAGRRAGLVTASEGFADRAYLPDGRLVPRSQGGAVLTDPNQVSARAVMLALERRVQAVDGSYLTLDVDTICVHGDTPGALTLVAAVRAALEHAGIDVRALRT